MRGYWNQCLLIILAVAFSSNATAGPIQWSGVRDIRLGFWGTSGADLDLDGDGSEDFFHHMAQEYFITGRLGTAVYGWLRPDPQHPGEMERDWDFPLASGQSIGSIPEEHHEWFVDGSATGGPFAYLASWLGPPYGPWLGVTNGYMGIRFNRGEDTYYGWMRMSVTAGVLEQTTIHDWAWNTTPGEGLWAGQTPEPSTCILFVLGGLTIALAARRHTRKPG